MHPRQMPAHPKIVIAPNAFKGSLTAWEASCAVEEGIKRGLKKAETVKIPMADGGDGTVDAMVRAAGGSTLSRTVSGPFGEKVKSRYGILQGGKTAGIEMALASGLALVPEDKKNPMKADTRGTGELMLSAMDEKVERIIIGIGGSATNDGGSGMARALGVRFLDGKGNDLKPGGGELEKLESIDLSGIDPRIKTTEIIIASDVTNPLCGPRGASRVYAPQKGASPETAERLDKALLNYSRVIKKDIGLDIKDIPGSGAAGGLGAGLIAFSWGKMRSGVGMMMEVSGFAEAVEGAFLVITGEGMIDIQTGYGKAPGEIARACRKKNIPVIGVCGALGEGAENLYRRGFSSFFPITRAPCTVEYAMANAYSLLAGAAERLARVIGAAGF